jgi:hypothetical protein
MIDFSEDIKWAKEFIAEAEPKMIGRMASPVPPEDIAILHHFLKTAVPPYFEVGVLWGGSMIIAGLSMPVGHLYGIDPFFGYMTAGKIDPYVLETNKGSGLVPTREIVEKNIVTYNLQDRVTLYTGFHPPLPEDLRSTDTFFGAVFIDGSHATQAVLADWNELKYHASDIVLFHDLHHKTIIPAWEKIKRDPMIDEILYEGGKGKFGRIGVVKMK